MSVQKVVEHEYGICHNCGSKDHFIKICPFPKRCFHGNYCKFFKQNRCKHWHPKDIIFPLKLGKYNPWNPNQFSKYVDYYPKSRYEDTYHRNEPSFFIDRKGDKLSPIPEINYNTYSKKRKFNEVKTESKKNEPSFFIDRKGDKLSPIPEINYNTYSKKRKFNEVKTESKKIDGKMKLIDKRIALIKKEKELIQNKNTLDQQLEDYKQNRKRKFEPNINTEIPKLKHSRYYETNIEDNEIIEICEPVSCRTRAKNIKK
jgi:hypothetical protein